jgi:hypothetical protein
MYEVLFPHANAKPHTTVGTTDAIPEFDWTVMSTIHTIKTSPCLFIPLNKHQQDDNSEEQCETIVEPKGWIIYRTGIEAPIQC